VNTNYPLVSPFSFDYDSESWTLRVQFRRKGGLSKEYQAEGVPPFWASKLIGLNRAKNFRRVAGILRRLGLAQSANSCVSQEKGS